MAYFMCPFGFPDDYGEHLQNDEFRSAVCIRRGICTSGYLCKINYCPFNDATREALKIFIDARWKDETEAAESWKIDQAIYWTILETYGLQNFAWDCADKDWPHKFMKIPEKLG